MSTVYNESLKCCGNCGYMENRLIILAQESIKALYPGYKNPACNAANALLCKIGKHPKYVDNVCDEWMFDLVHAEDRSIE